MNTEEKNFFLKKAIELIKQVAEFEYDNESYQKLIELGYYGFMHYYLQFSTNVETMSTTANHNVAMKLVKIDKQRDKKIIINSYA